MVQSFDWIVRARNNEDRKRIVRDALNADEDRQLCFDGKFRVEFYQKREYVEVYALSESSPLSCKIIPVRISYEAIEIMLDGDIKSLPLDGIEYLHDE